MTETNTNIAQDVILDPPSNIEDGNSTVSEGPELIPVNKGGQIEDEVSRFSSAIWFNKIMSKEIVLAGCGGIGSYVGFLIGRMKPKRLILVDPDRVELGNLSGQFYSSEDVGMYKVNALGNFIARHSSFTVIDTVARKYRMGDFTRPIMICGFDNMDARKTFYSCWKDAVMATNPEDRGQYLFIDGRLAAEEFQVFAIQGWDYHSMERYEEEWLFSDEEAEATLCSYKQTSYMANMIGSVMTNIFVNFCTNECGLVLPQEVPFMTTYRGDFMDFKVIR